MTSVLNLNAHDHPHAENRFGVIPTAERLEANPEYSGKGVTIAFLDTGFRPHPDLRGRIAAYHDVTDPEARLTNDVPEEFAWHGTQTSVVGAGDGFLSDGLHRSLAFGARVALIKVRGFSGIPEENTRRGLEWIRAHRERLGISIVSISVGGGDESPRLDRPVDRLAEALVREGVVVVAAAGNSGCTDAHWPLSPATAPSVITVGGTDDGNHPGAAHFGLYCSSYGVLEDGRMKPEVIAPAAWVAAPILPGTAFERRAEALSALAACPDYRFDGLSAWLWNVAELPEDVAGAPLDLRRKAVEQELRSGKIIATHYQHVDGTSFAAPIVASIVAQMLEANPQLKPSAVKRILMQTADRISGHDALRQGFGVVRASRAIEQALLETHDFPESDDLMPRRVGRDLVFFYHDHGVSRAELAGDFNGWTPEPMVLDDHGNWRLAVTPPPPGRYRYKVRLDGNRWIEDPGNILREPDGFGGMNSVLNLA